MNDIEIIFFAAVAVFFGYKLWSVLGKHSAEDTAKAAELHSILEKQLEKSKTQTKATKPALVLANDEDEKDIPAHLSQDVADIRKYDDDFTLKSFTEGSTGAFEIVTESFAKGKKDALKFLLSKDLYKNFDAEIKKHEKNELEISSNIVSINEPEILDIELKGSVCQVVVKFVSEQINFIKDKAGEIIEGSKSQIEHVTDIWVFERDLKSTAPNWVVVGTETA